MKIAVIGSGPAAAGICLGLIRNSNNLNIDVIDIGKTKEKFDPLMAEHPSNWTTNLYINLHKEILKKSKGLIPEKSYFGDFPSKYSFDTIYKSDKSGGLSKFWGASFLPFNSEDLMDWPISVEEMDYYYKEILKEVMVTGREDQLDRYFSSDYVNEPPIKSKAKFLRIEELVRKSDGLFIAGNPRLAIKNSGSEGCTYCGHCFYGCYKDAIYSSDQTINKLIQDKTIKYYNNSKLIKYKVLKEVVELSIENVINSTIDTKVYDKVYIAAGCIETTRIVANSMGLFEYQFPLVENPMYHFPFISTDLLSKDELDNSISLNNLLLGRMPGNGIEKYIHMQLYPINKYLWNHGLSKFLGSQGIRISNLVNGTIGKQIIMVLAYLHGDYSKGSSVTFHKDGTESLSIKGNDSVKDQFQLMVKELSSIFKRSNIKVLDMLSSPLSPGGSYHYAGTIPMNGDIIDKNCSINNKVYIADSSSFPSLPAQNHSFTIMANSFRIAKESLS